MAASCGDLAVCISCMAVPSRMKAHVHGDRWQIHSDMAAPLVEGGGSFRDGTAMLRVYGGSLAMTTATYTTAWPEFEKHGGDDKGNPAIHDVATATQLQQSRTFVRITAMLVVTLT